MLRGLSVSLRAGLLCALVAAGGCGTRGVEVLRPPLPAIRSVPALAVVEQPTVIHHELMLDAETNAYGPSPLPERPRWLAAERFNGLCREYLREAELFQQVAAAPPAGRAELYLTCRPRLMMAQYIRPSIGGTVLTFGTGLIYTVLGGSAHYRRVDLELAMDILTPTGRTIGTYISASRSPEKLATGGPDQLGPLVSYAFTRALEDVTSRISADNDLLMRALSADMTAKGVLPIGDSRMRIRLTQPDGVIVRDKTARVGGQVVGVDRAVRLVWYLNGATAGQVPLTDTSAESVKEFCFLAPLQQGIARIALSIQSAEEARGPVELARTETAYLCVADEKPAPEVRGRWAVVIGISRYAHSGEHLPDLKYAHRDAEAFCGFLRSPAGGGFAPERTLLLTDARATADEVRHGLFEFLAKAERDDLVVIFFSGHGMPQAGTDNFFMLCHDTRPDRLASTAFPMWDIDTALRRFVRAQRVVVLADACHAGAISAPAGTRGPGDNPVNQYLRQLALAQPGRLIFTASEARELSHESDKWGGGHGAFTYFLLEGLSGKADADANGLVDIGEIIDFVRAKVSQATNNAQHPDPSGQYDRKLPLAVLKGK